jgi:predicted nucleic acid-binding protein
MLVVDASAVADWLLDRPAATRIDRLVDAHGDDLHAPHLLDVEVLSSLRAMTLRGVLQEQRAEDALNDFTDLTIERYAHELLVPGAWRLRKTMSAYDAVYVALTETLAPDGAVLLTADARLARTAAPLCRVELVDRP